MRERRDRLDSGAQYLVLCRACAELYAEIAAFFSERPDVVVVVDRRRVETAPRGYLDPVLPEIVA
jgi:hypothetical protein